MKELTTGAAFVGRRPFLRSLSLLAGAAMVSPGGLLRVGAAQGQEADAPQLSGTTPATRNRSRVGQ